MTDKEALQIFTGIDVHRLENRYDLVVMATQVAMRALEDKLNDFDVALLMAIDALAEKVKRQEELDQMLVRLADEHGENTQ